MNQDQLTIAAFCYGWVCAVLQANSESSFEEIVEHFSAVTNQSSLQILNGDTALQDDVADFEVRHNDGSISGYIRLNKETNEWSLDNCFDIYHKDELIKENHAFEF